MNHFKCLLFAFSSALTKPLLLLTGIGALASCQTLFGDLSVPNPANCSATLDSCQADETCHPQREVCVPALELYRATPNLGSSAGGIAVSLYGERFLPGVTVELDGQLVPNVEVKSSTELSFVLPASTQGHFVAPITVRNPTGHSIRQDSLFRYYADKLSFGERQTSLPSSANDLQIADFTGDGRPDVLLGLAGEATLYHMASTKEGLFQTPKLSTAAMNPYRTDRIVPIQLPTDKYPGALIAWNNQVQWYSGNGSGSFGGQTRVTVGGSVAAMEPCKSGRTDAQTLFVSTVATQELFQLALRSDGTQETPVRIAQGIAAPAIRCVDLDGDGKEELLSVDGVSALTVWWLHKPGGLTQQQISTAGVCIPNGLVAADFDQDGATDVVVSCNQGILRFRNEQGNLVPKPIITSPSILGSGLLSADLSGDGWPDLVYVDRGQKRIVSQLADRLGSYLPPTVLHADPGQNWLGFQRLLAADFNDDSKLDVVYSAVTNGTSFILLTNQSK